MGYHHDPDITETEVSLSVDSPANLENSISNACRNIYRPGGGMISILDESGLVFFPIPLLGRQGNIRHDES